MVGARVTPRRNRGYTPRSLCKKHCCSNRFHQQGNLFLRRSYYFGDQFQSKQHTKPIREENHPHEERLITTSTTGLLGLEKKSRSNKKPTSWNLEFNHSSALSGGGKGFSAVKLREVRAALLKLCFVFANFSKLRILSDLVTPDSISGSRLEILRHWIER